MPEQKINKKYVSVKTYAILCGVTPHAIYQRIYRSQDGIHERGDSMFLETCTIKECEGIFINTETYPPVENNKKRKEVNV